MPSIGVFRFLGPTTGPTECILAWARGASTKRKAAQHQPFFVCQGAKTASAALPPTPAYLRCLDSNTSVTMGATAPIPQQKKWGPRRAPTASPSGERLSPGGAKDHIAGLPRIFRCTRNAEHSCIRFQKFDTFVITRAAASKSDLLIPNLLHNSI